MRKLNIENFAGKFIVLDGADGSGKSTQARMLAEKLKAMGHDVLLTREPGGTVIGEKLRPIILDKNLTEMTPVTELFLYMACRTQFVDEVVRPALRDGKIVVSERYFWSTICYQGYAGGLDIKEIVKLSELATGNLYPDLTIIPDVTGKTGLNRVETRGKEVDRMEVKGTAFHEKVSAGYRQLATDFPDKINLVDGTESIEAVHLKILDFVKGIL